MVEQRRGNIAYGCLMTIFFLLVGAVGGSLATANLLGFGPEDLIARGQAVLSGSPVPRAPAGEMSGGPPATVIQPIAGGVAQGRRLLWHGPVALDSDTKEPDLLLISRNYDRESSDTLAYLSPDRQAFRWESQPMGDEGNSWVVATNSQTIFVAAKARLMAISRSDGSQIWEAALSDEIAYSICADCLLAFDDLVVALPNDGVVQAFDAASGQARWSVRLREATRQLVRVDDLVGAIDARAEGSSEAALLLYRASDGELVRTIEPTCQQEGDSFEDRPHYYDPVLSDGRGGLYWLLDSANCLLRFDGASGELSWQAFDERFSSTLVRDHMLFADGTLYMGYSNQLMAVNEQGSPQLINAQEDYTMIPLAARPGTLLALAERTRGTRRYEIWALDPASGERRWTHVLSADDPIADFYDSGDFAVNIVGEAVVVVEQTAEPKQITFSRLGLADGAVQLSAPLAVDDPSDFLRGATWGRGTLWLAVDELYGVDINSGALSYRWP